MSKRSSHLDPLVCACRRNVRILAAAAFIFLLTASALAQDAEALRIGQVRVQGNDTVSTDTILREAHARGGAVFSEQMLADDARRILALPQVAEVRWEASVAANLVDVTFIIRETQRIEQIQFLGAKNFSIEELAKQISFSAGDYLDRYLLREAAQKLEQFYEEKGYYFARVRLNEQLLEEERTVAYIIVEGPKLRVKKVQFVGRQAFSNWTLKNKCKTKAYFPIFSRGRLSDEKLEQDERTLQQFYRDNAYLDARVFSEVEYNEDRSRAFVTFYIEEGPEYKIAGFQFQGNEYLSQEQLRDALPVKPGQAYTSDREIIARRAIERRYGQDGYIYTAVAIEPQYTATPGEVQVRFRLNEGGQFNLGRVLIQGNTTTQDKVVRRAFDHFKFLPDGLYDTQAMERGKKRLTGAGLFEDVNVTPIGNEPDSRDALVEVREARTGMVLFGVGVDTNSGVLGQFAIEQRNFDIARPPSSLKELLLGEAFKGAGQLMRVSFSPGTRVTTGHIKFYEPYLFDQEYYLDTTLMLFRRWRESYLEERRGGNVTLGRRFENDWNAEVTFRLEEVRVTDLEDAWLLDRSVDPPVRYHTITAPPDAQDVEGSNFLTSVRFGIGQNHTDNLYRPTEGYKINADWEQYGALGGEFTFAALGAGATWYHTLYEDITERRTVWATALRGNHIVGDAPLFERYYAGGIGTLRGFEYRGVSPRDGRESDPIGSDYRVLLNTEITHPIYEEILFGKVFCDSGLVSEGPYRVTVGFGFEMVIPQLFQMVPMHFDFGFPIRQDDKDDTQVFSFSFGLQF